MTTGKVLKERRSPRERGRMGSSLTAAAAPYVPAGHASHFTFPSPAENDPTAHGAQTELPGVAAKCPAGHGSQLDFPGASPKDPDEVVPYKNSSSVS